MIEFDNIFEKVELILNKYNQEYFFKKEKNEEFYFEIIEEFKKEKLMDIFVLTKNNYKLQDYIKFQEILIKKDITLAFIYNQHVSFIKYLEKVPTSHHIEKIFENISINQCLCSIALAENGSHDFLAATSINDKFIEKKKVTNANFADYYLVNFLKNGHENFTVLKKENIILSKDVDILGLISSSTKTLQFDFNNMDILISDDNQLMLKKNVMPWISSFIVTALYGTIEQIHNFLKEKIMYTYLEVIKKYLFEIETVRNNFIFIDQLFDTIKSEFTNFKQTMNFDPVKLVKYRLKYITYYNQIIFEYRKMINLGSYSKWNYLNKKIRDCDGLLFISPSPLTLLNFISNMEFYDGILEKVNK